MSFDTVGSIVGMVAGLGGLTVGGISLWLHAARQMSEQRQREIPARLWVKEAQITTFAAPNDLRPDARVLELTHIKVAYMGGGRPFTVFDASLLVEGEAFHLGGLMPFSHHIPAQLGGDFVIDHGREGQGLCVRAPDHKTFTLRLDCGDADFREVTFTPTLLPDPHGHLVYRESEREATYHDSRPI